jgi:hypothetical protein
MYANLCDYFYAKKISALKPGSELQLCAEHNIWTKKEVKLGSRKLLDMELHELYHLIDKLVTNWRATMTIGKEPTEHNEGTRKT